MSDVVKFLLVDDVEENLVALNGLLRRDGLELHMARSGLEALELLLVHDFALALIDVQMPELDGFELAELMRGTERSRHVPIIFVTAGARDQHRVFKGYESGAVDFLFKPIDPVILRHKADVFFVLSEQRNQLARDVTERDRLLREIEETLRLNEMFLAALSHDLRNPLNAIMAGAGVIAHGNDEHTASVGRRILSSGSRMATMIDQLLDLARARVGGGFTVAPAPADLSIIVQRVVAEHQDGLGHIAITTESRGDCSGVWDEARLAQVMSNLLSNAIEHGTPSDVVAVRIDGTQPGSVTVSVSNRGVIRHDLLPTLFEPFRSGRNTGRSGLGLGLYIVHQIVQAHRGTIEARSSEHDCTTTFEFRLPRTTLSEPALARS